MFKNCFPHEIVATLVTFIYSSQQKHHILEKLVLTRPLTYVIDAFDYNLINDLTSVPIDQNHPLVDDKTFILELNFNCLKHLYASNNIM